jgi:surface polysaccharide O-acyltransferase-like enzyme
MNYYEKNYDEEEYRILINNSNEIINLEKNYSKLKNKRIDYFDWLRILASFSVISIHVSAQNWDICPIKSHEWKIFNFYDAIVRFGVPIFFMISGTIFLEKNISFSIMLKKYIKNIYINFIFCSFFYSLRKKIIKNYTYKKTFLLILNGHYHLWFLYRICGLYLITPFLKEITKKEVLLNIFLIINFIFGFLFPNLLTFLFYYSKEYYNTIKQILQKIGLNGFLNNNLLYYIFGFYLNKKNISPLFRIIIYFFGICGMIFSFEITYYASAKKNKKISVNSSNYFNAFLMSIAIFIFFKYNFSCLGNKKRIKEIIQKLGHLTFGIYIIHPFVIEELNIRIKLNTLSFDPLYSVPINSLIIFFISLLIAYFIKLIPFINRYIF